MKIKILLTCVVLVALAGYWLMSDQAPAQDQAGAAEPLYWVAPMDPNFRRDGPGLSPMGMALVPVYENDGSAPGVVEISPAVVNNLGVRTVRVDTGRLAESIHTVGYIEYDEASLMHMHPRVEGWIERLAVASEGEAVSEGQLVYSLYSPALVNAQEEYLLALQRDNSDLIRSAEARMKALQVPDQHLQRIREQGRVFQQVDFHAPRAGVIASLNVRQGQFVQPGTSLLSIASLEEIWVRAEVFERQSAKVAKGDHVTMTAAAQPGREWHGAVDYVYPTMNARTRTLQVRLRFSNEDRVLRPNMFTELRIDTAPGPERLLVPNEAIISTGQQDRVVRALGEGRFKSVAVRLGQRGRDDTEVLEGLEPGDHIVSSAQFLLDSESSIDSDFQRMAPTDEEAVMPAMDHSQHQGMQMNDESEEMDHSQHQEMPLDDDNGEMDHSQHPQMEH